MNFTREPILETIITARSGYYLLVQSISNPSSQFRAESVQVISFGKDSFYCSLEKPSFLAPVRYYEIRESKEEWIPLKGVKLESREKSGNNREISHKELHSEEKAASDNNGMPNKNKKRDHPRRRHEEKGKKEPLVPTVSDNKKVEENYSDGKESFSRFVPLIPVPTKLISDSVHRYKEQQSESGLAGKEPSPSEESREGFSEL